MMTESEKKDILKAKKYFGDLLDQEDQKLPSEQNWAIMSELQKVIEKLDSQVLKIDS